MIAVRWTASRPEALNPVRVSDIADQEIRRGLDEISMEFERRVKLNTPVGVFGEAGLRGSIHGEVIGVPGRQAVIGHSCVYGDIIELGRRPGPISKVGRQSIELWVQRKLGISAQEAPRVAFLVARKIAKRGFAGAHMFQRALDEGKGVLQTLWNRVGELIAERLR